MKTLTYERTNKYLLACKQTMRYAGNMRYEIFINYHNTNIYMFFFMKYICMYEIQKVVEIPFLKCFFLYL